MSKPGTHTEQGKGVGRVLVIRIGRLGDTIMATTVIDVLQRCNGEGIVIDFAASPGASTALLGMDHRVNRVFPIAHRGLPWRLHPAKRALEKHARENPYDLVINLECGTECDDFARFIRTREFLGRPHITPTHRVDRHCVDTEKTIYAKWFGSDLTAAAQPSLHLDPISSSPFQPGTPYVVINPGFSGIHRPGYRSHRRWPDSCWRELIELLNENFGVHIAVNGTAQEQGAFASLLEMPGVHSLFGSSLATLAEALLNARCVITVDTGTMHFATALGTPVIALFGPGNPQLTGPYSKTVQNQVLTSGVDCQPCVGSAEQKRCQFNRCMSELEPLQVFEACRRILENDS